MKYFSMFSGIGGFELGIQRILPDASCVGYSEIDKYACQIYRDKFKGHKNYGDATKINPEDIPAFDLLVGGFPCQAFSVAGERRGFEDARGTLFFEIARILEEKKPRHLLLENVKGLLSHDKGRTFQTMLGILSDLGYRVEWQIFNSKDFGVPQNRERIFIIGHLRGECSRQVFPIAGNAGQALEELTVGQSQGNRVYSADGISTTLASNAGGVGAKTGLYAVPTYVDGKRQVHYKRTDIAPTIRATEYKAGDNQMKIIEKFEADDITTIHEKGIIRIRRLTPRECERLQAFPDDFTKTGVDKDGNEVEISDTQRYKTLGNAVTVNVVSAITSEMIPCF